MTTAPGNIGGASALVDEQKHPGFVSCCAHGGTVSAVVIGVLELSIVRVVIANLLPVEGRKFDEIDLILLLLNSTTQPIAKQGFVDGCGKKEYAPSDKCDSDGCECQCCQEYVSKYLRVFHGFFDIGQMEHIRIGL